MNIADSSGPWLSFNQHPSINNHGTVAFGGQRRGEGPAGIYTGNGGPITTIADPSGPLNSLDYFPSINDMGDVSFWARYDVPAANDNYASAIFVGSGGPLKTIYRYSNYTGGSAWSTSINNSGSVAFNLGDQLFSSDGNTLIPILVGELGSFAGTVSHPNINDSGTVAFWTLTSTSSGLRRVYAGNGGPVTTIANVDGVFRRFGGFPSVNSSGTVAFFAELDDGSFGIYTGNGDVITEVIEFGGAFRTHTRANDFFTGGPVGINDSGALAFEALLAVGGGGIFTGSDPLSDKVILTGDALFGSKVRLLSFGGLNDSGDIAFHYHLESGISGVAVAKPVANVPEPSSCLIGLIALVAISFVHRRLISPQGWNQSLS